MQLTALLPLLALLTVSLTDARASHRDALAKRDGHHARAAARVVHEVERRESLAKENPQSVAKPARKVKRGANGCRVRGESFSSSASSAAPLATTPSVVAVSAASAAAPTTTTSPVPDVGQKWVAPYSEVLAPSAAPSPSPSPAGNTGNSGGNTGNSGGNAGSPGGRKAGASGEETLSAFAGHISWFWNYQPTTYSGSTPDGLIFIPTLWGNGGTGSQDWGRLQSFKSLSWSPQYVQGFYEPDCSPPMSSAIDPWTAAGQWKELIVPWKAKGATLISPGMCKQADEDWLTPFKQQIGDDNMWDITSVHINKVDMDGVHKVLDHYWDTYGKPMFVTEFACVDDQNGFTPCTDQGQINNYINGIVDILQADTRVLAYSMSEGMGLGDVWPPYKDGQLTPSGWTYLNAISKY